MSLYRIIIIIHIFALNIKGEQLVVCRVWYNMVICLPVFLGGRIVERGTDKIFGMS